MKRFIKEKRNVAATQFITRLLLVAGVLSAALVAPRARASDGAYAVIAEIVSAMVDCGLVLGPNQCRSLDRCERAKYAMQLAKTGGTPGAQYLLDFVHASDMQAACVAALSSGRLSQLMQACQDVVAGVESLQHNEISVKNDCRYPIFVAAHYLMEDIDYWDTKGWWKLTPGGSAYIFNTKNRYHFLAAETVDAETPVSRLTWGGSYTWKLGDRDISFFQVDTGDKFIKWTTRFTCN